MITQVDLDTLVQCGAYTALCNAATEELKRRTLPRDNRYLAISEEVPRPNETPRDGHAELARLNHLLNRRPVTKTR